MTNNEMNQAIAEACGWEDVKPYAVDNGKLWGYEPTIDGRDFTSVPNYCACLNAIHEAEKVLTKSQLVKYRLLLASNSDGPNKQFLTVEAAMCHATARQRAEAFITVLTL